MHFENLQVGQLLEVVEMAERGDAVVVKREEVELLRAGQFVEVVAGQSKWQGRYWLSES